MATSVSGQIKAGTLVQLKQRGCMVVTGGGQCHSRVSPRGPGLRGGQPLPPHGLSA